MSIILIFIAISSIAFAVYYKIKMQKIIKNIDKMLDDAINGSFTEKNFDESVLSALENKLWKYLSFSEISAQKTAEERDKIKTLISDISHQTKTPVSNIQLYSELLMEMELSEQSAEYAKKICSQSEKLAFLINSLVSLSRLETGIIKLNPKKNRISYILDELNIEYSGKAQEKGLIFNMPDTDITAIYDEKWTIEAIGNILDNAIKYTDNGEINISVKEYEMFVCIDISDTGIGISEEEQPKIFSRFYRSESVSSKSGAGIGLYLAREIISEQDGYIKVNSTKNKGSTFSVYLSK